jgi:hypothetical protein
MLRLFADISTKLNVFTIPAAPNSEKTLRKLLEIVIAFNSKIWYNSFHKMADYCTQSLHLSIPLYFFTPMARQPLGGLGLLIVPGFAIKHFALTTLGRTPLDE